MDELQHDRVRLTIDAGLAEVTLARPDAGNGFDLGMASGIRDAAEAVANGAKDGSVRAAVLAGQGKVFSVGGDLAYFGGDEGRGDRMREVAGALHDALRLLATAPATVVTALHGVVAGGGIGLALVGDVVLAGPRAKFRLAYTAGGLSPDCGTSWLLPRRIGHARAMDLALTNRVVGAEEAERWGLVSRLTESDDVLGEARALAAELAAGPQEALAMTKQLLWTGLEQPFGTQLDHEAETIARLVETPDGREGIDAFLAKRAPKFR